MSKKSNLNNGFLISYDWLPALESLSGDDYKALLTALINRQKNNAPFPQFTNPTVGIFANMIEPTIKRRLDGQTGGNTTKEGTMVGTMVGTTVGTTVGTMVGTMVGTTVGSKEKKSKEEKSKEENIEISDDISYSAASHSECDTKNKKQSNFVKPTVEEIRQYCEERNNGIDPEVFYHHYESNGWKVGKAPMKSWKSAVITWEKNRKTEGGTSNGELYESRASNERNNACPWDLSSITTV